MVKIRVYAGNVSREDLVDLYELTYKYQMFQQEMTRGDYGLPQPLSDRAYLAFEQTKDQLARRLEVAYTELIRAYEEYLADAHRRIEKFDAIVPALDNVQQMLDKLKTEWEPLPQGLDADIVLYQEALTTAHNTGTMAEYYVNMDGRYDTYAGEFLRQLSEGENVQDWNEEMSRLLGYPVGSRYTQPNEWFVSSRIKKVISALAP